ncbi:hypothetical protein [uncultured Kordia sp.]|uniref:hypothetical protein n=1 Tax=uncultured Kordia sp. TaxID=507699 RepID=UPI002629D7BE|nr:hypothetical protein [uncultured Kordia sp.]
MSFFLYFYAVKIQITILLFFIFALNLHANIPNKADDQLQDNITSNVVPSQGEQAGSYIISPDEGGSGTLKGSLNSILGYSIFIFFSVLIIILIDNRNLEKRYKKLVSDFKNKDPLL